MRTDEPGNRTTRADDRAANARVLLRRLTDLGMGEVAAAQLVLTSPDRVLARAIDAFELTADDAPVDARRWIVAAVEDPERIEDVLERHRGWDATRDRIIHQTAAMSLRYGRLFDATVRADYERALAQAKAHLGGPVLSTADAARLPILGDWKDASAIKARMAGGYCIRTPAQGSCAYANICEHCPNYRSDPTFLPILAAQKTEAEKLAADAQARGWIDEADRHLQLVERLDALMSNTAAS